MSDQKTVVTIYLDSDMVHASYYIAGAQALAFHNRWEVQYKTYASALPSSRFVFRAVIERGGVQKKLAFDNHDYASRVDAEALRWSDHYFKVNHRRQEFESCGLDIRKIEPAGPYVPVAWESDGRTLQRWGGNALALIRWRATHRKVPFKKAIGDCREIFARPKRLLSRKPIHMYEQPPFEKAPEGAPLVFFNPRYWEGAPDSEQVNADRAALIIGLRRVLGKRFEGGFRRCDAASKRYPDAMERRSYSHQEYMYLTKSAPISIYSNGLSGCFSWRLIENFASSRCIVAERIPNDAHFPLSVSNGIVQCGSIDAMINTVAGFAEKRNERRAMQYRAWDTYQRHLHPVRNMARMFDLAMQPTMSRIAESMELPQIRMDKDWLNSLAEFTPDQSDARQPTRAAS